MYFWREHFDQLISGAVFREIRMPDHRAPKQGSHVRCPDVMQRNGNPLRGPGFGMLTLLGFSCEGTCLLTLAETLLVESSDDFRALPDKSVRICRNRRRPRSIARITRGTEVDVSAMGAGC